MHFRERYRRNLLVAARNHERPNAQSMVGFDAGVSKTGTGTYTLSAASAAAVTAALAALASRPL
jgi:hypothetical protein